MNDPSAHRMTRAERLRQGLTGRVRAGSSRGRQDALSIGRAAVAAARIAGASALRRHAATTSDSALSTAV